MLLPLCRLEGGSIHLASGLSNDTPVMCGNKPEGYSKTNSWQLAPSDLCFLLSNDNFLCIIVFKPLKP